MSPFKLRQAAQAIQQGGLIAYPTEAVFGLGCDPLNPHAVHRLLQLKARPASKGLILIAADFDQLQPFVTPLAESRMQEILASWPGPHTWLLPAAADCPRWLRGRHSTLAVRVTAHPLAAALCATADTPLVSTSANRAGQTPARDALRTRICCGRELDMILSGPTGGAAKPTTIRDGATGKLLR